jgi:hypothetical protein
MEIDAARQLLYLGKCDNCRWSDGGFLPVAWGNDREKIGAGREGIAS